MQKKSFEEFKEKNLDYYNSLFAKYKKLFKADVIAVNGETTIEAAMFKAYEDECFYEDFLREKKAD
ncbi:MAG: hypothetical protein ACLGG7_02970 [Bacteriovoracia bacterium]